MANPMKIKWSGAKTVLVVEDSPVQATALVQFLKQMDLQVIHAFNGRVGVEIAQQCQPDLILLDVEMPEMDGYEACRRLKADVQTGTFPRMHFRIRCLRRPCANCIFWSQSRMRVNRDDQSRV